MSEIKLVRRIDDLGRIVIPKEIRKIVNIKEGDAFEISIGENKELILRRNDNGL